jgi:hypothetical protein
VTPHLGAAQGCAGERPSAAAGDCLGCQELTTWAGNLVNELLAPNVDLVALALPVLASALKLFRSIRALPEKAVTDGLYFESVLIDVLPEESEITAHRLQGPREELAPGRSEDGALSQCLTTTAGVVDRCPSRSSSQPPRRACPALERSVSS